MNGYVHHKSGCGAAYYGPLEHYISLASPRWVWPSKYELETILNPLLYKRGVFMAKNNKPKLKLETTLSEDQ